MHCSLQPLSYCLSLGHLRQGLHPLHVPIRRRLQAGGDKPSRSTVSGVGKKDPCCPMGRILESFNQCCGKGLYILRISHVLRGIYCRGRTPSWSPTCTRETWSTRTGTGPRRRCRWAQLLLGEDSCLTKSGLWLRSDTTIEHYLSLFWLFAFQIASVHLIIMQQVTHTFKHSNMVSIKYIYYLHIVS